jgi:hypothetical protein
LRHLKAILKATTALGIFATFSCTQAVTSDKAIFNAVKKASLVDRQGQFLGEGGMIIGWNHDRDRPYGEGDSLLFTGIAMATLGCDYSNSLFPAWEKMISQYGTFVRYLPLGNYEKDNPASLDGWLGVAYGFVVSSKECPGLKNKLSSVWSRAVSKLSKTRPYLYKKTDRWTMDPVIFGLMVLVDDYLKGKKQSSWRAPALVAYANSWTKATVLAKHHCFRIHLATLIFLTLEEMGYKTSKILYCKASKSADIPLSDFICKNPRYLDFLKNYKPNEWEYRHQRCGSWEKPDGKWDIHYADLDYLLLEKLATR